MCPDAVVYILYLGVVGKYCRFYYYALVVGFDYATYFVCLLRLFSPFLRNIRSVDGALQTFVRQVSLPVVKMWVAGSCNCRPA